MTVPDKFRLCAVRGNFFCWSVVQKKLNVVAMCVQVGQTTLKGRPDKRNIRPPHQISPSLSHFDLTFHLTFHSKFIKSIPNLFQIHSKYNIQYFKELCKLSITHFKSILIVQVIYKAYLKMERLFKSVDVFVVVSSFKYI